MDADGFVCCETEPLAFSNSIQPHGGRLCLDVHLGVSHVSEQIERFVTSLLVAGHALPDELGAVLFPVIATLSHMPGSRCELLAVEGIGPLLLDMVVVRSNLNIIVELVPHLLQVEEAGFKPRPVRPPVNIQSQEAAPLDPTYSSLRAPSPVHCA